MTAAEIITLLDLKPLPWEGGYFRETYRSGESLPASALPERYAGERQFCTAIYYLLTPDTISAMHRVKSDEVFHFYLGAPVTMLLLYPDGRGETVRLGADLARGARPQCVVPRGVWQGAFMEGREGFALMGTTVAPGFDFNDFELGDRAALTAAYPTHRGLIERLTRG